MHVPPHSVTPNSPIFFGGTITQTIQSTTDTGKYRVGQILSGYYQYASTSINGTFSPAGTVTPSGAQTLTGLIYLTYPAYGGHLNSLALTQLPCTLVVAGGVVTSFVWRDESGSFWADFNQVHFSTRPASPSGPQDLTTSGSVVFSPPQQL